MDINYAAVLPEIILTLVGIAIMLWVPFLSKERQVHLGYVAFGGTIVALIPVCATWGQRGLTFFDTIFYDPFGQFCKAFFLLATAAVILASVHFLKRENLPHGEYFSLLLFATVGMSLMVTSADLILTFLGLEILSIATYVLAGFRPENEKSTESAWKYFILGAFSTAFMLYGIAFLYGATGTTKYLDIAQAIQESGDSLTLLVGLGLVVVGFGFKAALAPFHVWTPDVYEGAPVPITAHLAVASKAAAIFTFLRILYQVLPDLSSHWQVVLWVSAVLTLFIGNIAALVQTNIKRMLAYSSIAHAGYLLVGLVGFSDLSGESILFYLAAYGLMSLGAFTAVQLLSRENERHLLLQDYAGAGYRHPFLALSLTVFLISLAGIPSTAGFMGKLFLFSAAIQNGFYWLVILGVVASAVGVYYYLRVIVLMYMEDPVDEATSIPVPLAARLVILVMIVGTFYLGLLPGSFLGIASEAARF